VFKVGGEGEVGAVEQGAAVEASPGPEPCARWHSPAPRAKRQTTLFGRFKYVPPPGEAAEVEEAAGAAAAADPLPPPRDLSPAASTAPPSAPPPAPTPMPPPPPAASKEGGDEYADVFSFL